MIKTNTQTITLDGTEQEVRFNRNYPYFFVQNQGSSDVLMSTDSGITYGKDGVMTVLSGGTACTMHGYDLDRFYLMGTGKVQVVGTYSAHCPFKSAQGGGDNTAFGAASYSLANAADYPILGINLYGKSTQDGTPTPTNPVDIVSVGDSGTVEITACGKNLVNPTEITTGGFNYDTGTELNNSARARTGYIAVTPAYLVGSVPNGYSIISIYHYTAAKEYLGVGVASLLKGQNGFIRLLFKRTDGAKITDDDLNTLKSTLIVTNGESVDYEPYQGSTSSITSALPLCGIPVGSGGNYTDSTGHQWVCDELIYNADGTGKVVKYTGKTVFDGSDDERWTNATINSEFTNDLRIQFSKINGTLAENINSSPTLYCNRLQYNNTIWKTDISGCYIAKSGDFIVRIPSSVVGGTDVTAFKSWLANNPLIIVYQIAPQEIELTAAEMTALRELQTYSGVTNIFNSGGANIDVKFCTNKMLSEYVAPITTGLQAQIDELKAAVLSLGGNV